MRDSLFVIFLKVSQISLFLATLPLTASGYKGSVFFTILNHRYSRRLPTVFTTNARVEVTQHDIHGLSEYLGLAACSCLKAYGLKVVRMDGPDY